MKPGVSSLNPYAALYIPLSKRETKDNIEVHRIAMKDFMTGDENSCFAPPAHLAQNQHHSRISRDSDGHGTDKLSSPEVFTLKNPSVQDSFGFLSQNPGEMTDKQMMDEELDMDMEYLQMTFPGLSNQSIADVYWANNGDLEETVDMLNQLEIYSVESSENLPDTLDIGDVPESGSSRTCTLKLKNVTSEAGASSSGSSDPAVVS